MKRISPYTAFFVATLMLIFLAGPKQSLAGKEPDDPGRRLRAIAPSLARPVTAVMFGLKEKRFFLVDVRSASEFETCHIPGALNIALHAIKTKAFLKKKPVVLCNAGYDLASLVSACEDLNQNGYRVTIMAGGLWAWKAKGGALAGDPFAVQDLNLITPRQYHREHAAGHQTVAHITDSPDERDTAAFPNAAVLPISDTAKLFARIKKWTRKKNADPFASIVLMTTTGKDDHRLRRLLTGAGLHHHVYILEGGLEAYQAYLENGRLAQKTKDDRTQRTGDCRSCAGR